MRAASTTTQSCATGDFLKVNERPRIGGDLCDGSFSETASLQSAGRFYAFFSGPEIPFPGNGDRERQRFGSNAGYAEGSPSIWCCRDHVGEARHSHAMRQPPRDGRFHEIGRQEGKTGTGPGGCHAQGGDLGEVEASSVEAADRSRRPNGSSSARAAQAAAAAGVGVS